MYFHCAVASLIRSLFESVEKAQRIRNIMLTHLKKGVGMKIKENLSSDEKKILKEIISDPSTVSYTHLTLPTNREV